jgi:peptidoglycan/LPS O-acetylase OafA/YrhL
VGSEYRRAVDKTPTARPRNEVAVPAPIDTTSEKRRLLALDGLRGLAALSVLVFHYSYRGIQLYPQLGAPVKASSWGYYGVALFFVISGFVILMSLQGSTPRRFVLSRAIRLLPIYWIAAAITYTVVTVTQLPGRQVTPIQALENVPMVENLWGGRMIDGVYWTLGVEVFFYAVVGILYFAGAFRGRRLTITLLSWLVIVCAVANVYRYLLEPALHQPGLSDVVTAFQWMPLFVLGIVFYRLWKRDFGFLNFLTGVAAVLAAWLTMQDTRLMIVLVVICGLLVLALWGPKQLLGNRPLRFLGDISYPLYLIHQNLGYLLLLTFVAIGLPRAFALPSTGACALVVATLLTYLVDRPLRRWLRGRLLHSNSVASAT